MDIGRLEVLQIANRLIFFKKIGILKNTVAEVQNRRAVIYMTHWTIRNSVFIGLMVGAENSEHIM